MSRIVISANDHMSPDLARLAQALRDMKPALKRIEREILRPLAETAWMQGGVQSRTGELRQAITPWSGKRQAGVTIRRGSGLAIPKAGLLMKGAKKHKFKKRAKYTVFHPRTNRPFARKNLGSPWGRVRKRAFFPTRQELMGKTNRIELILAEFLRRSAEGQ